MFIFFRQAPTTTTSNNVDQDSLAAAEDTSQDNKKEEEESITLKTESSLLKEAIVNTKAKDSEKRSIPIFVMCTMMQQPMLGSENGGEEKFSAATLADVLVELPASLPFHEVVSYVLNQLHLMKDDTFCSKGETLVPNLKHCKNVKISFFAAEVVISNWKPLNIEAICQEDRSKSVEDILAQISSVPTLKLTLRSNTIF